MYKTASDNSQARASRLSLAQLCSGPGWLELPIEERRANLVRQVKAIDSEIEAAPKNSELRRTLGREKQDICQAIHTLRPKTKSPGIEQFFIDAARETLTKSMFMIIWQAAQDRMKAAGQTEASA